MELFFLTAAGAAGGLATVVVQQAFWPLFEWIRRFNASMLRSRSVAVQLVQSAVHTLCGAGLGVVFWLSWGLTAIVDISWWMRGLTFGLLSWLVLVVPALLLTWLGTRLSWPVILGLLLETMSTCVCAGLACGWSWAKSP